MEIEVEDYVRSKIGEIGKVVEIKDNPNRVVIEHGQIILIADIVKNDKDIKKLIEPGDYINLERVLDITGEYIRTTETIHNKSWLSTNIKSIVTHEQFSSIEYKVESEEK